MAKRKTKAEKQRDEELKQLGFDLFCGKIFTDRHVREFDGHLMPHIFMPLLFIDSATVEEWKQSPPGMICEYFGRAGQLCINGYPIFHSMRILSKEDTGVVFEYYEKFKRAKERVT